ncbi:MAG: CDP-2,3-bis-(O-geranylgeranyl)-sn-glycerol synthase [Patescibacteria group bacterium]
MWLLVFKSFYLILPAYLANMAPVIFDKLGWFRSLARPVDGGRKIGRDFVFGRSKTWRGFVAGAIFGLVVSFIQYLLTVNDFFASISLVDYQKDFLIFGVWAGLGAISGDLVKSFFKRRISIKSGRSWPIFDQLDFIAGFFLFTYWLVKPDWEIIIAVCLLTLVLHPLTNVVSYFLGMKKVWW